MIVCRRTHVEDRTDFEPEMENFLIILKVLDRFELLRYKELTLGQRFCSVLGMVGLKN